MSDDLEAQSAALEARLAERRKEAEEAVGRLVAFIQRLEAMLKAARESLDGIRASAGLPAPRPAAPTPVAPPPAAAETRPPPPRAPAAPVIPPALWNRIQEIEAAGTGQLLGPEAEALGLQLVEGGNMNFVDELMVRGWTLHPTVDGMVYSRVAAQQILAARKAALDARQAAGKG